MPIWINYEIDGRKNSFVASHDKVTLHKAEYADGKMLYEFNLPELGGSVEISRDEYEKIESQMENVLHQLDHIGLSI